MSDAEQQQPAAVTSPLTTTPPINIAGHNTTLSVEPEEHADDRRLRLHKDKVLFWFCLAAVTVALLACGYALLFTSLSSDDKRNVFAILTLILGEIIGYFLKK